MTTPFEPTPRVRPSKVRESLLVPSGSRTHPWLPSVPFRVTGRVQFVGFLPTLVINDNNESTFCTSCRRPYILFFFFLVSTTGQESDRRGYTVYFRLSDRNGPFRNLLPVSHLRDWNTSHIYPEFLFRSSMSSVLPGTLEVTSVSRLGPLPLHEPRREISLL